MGQNEKEKRFDNFIVIATIVMTVLLLFHNYNSKRALFLNPYIPVLVFLFGTIVGLLIIYFVRRQILKIKGTISNQYSDFVILVKSLFLAALIGGMLSLWTFYYFNLKSSLSSEIEAYKCKVLKISLSSAAGTHNSIDFEFLRKNISISNFKSTELMQHAFQVKNFSDYNMYLRVRKGLFNSYIIDDYYFDH
jgi:hypothetical protein